MVKELITIGSFLVGSAGMGVVAYMNSNPYAFLHTPAASPAFQPAARIETPVVADGVDSMEASVRSEHSTLPRRPGTVSRASARPERVPVESQSEPVCNWREVGVQYVQEGVPTGMRRVRDLCE